MQLRQSTIKEIREMTDRAARALQLEDDFAAFESWDMLSPRAKEHYRESAWRVLMAAFRIRIGY